MFLEYVIWELFHKNHITQSCVLFIVVTFIRFLRNLLFYLILLCNFFFVLISHCNDWHFIFINTEKYADFFFFCIKMHQDEKIIFSGLAKIITCIFLYVISGHRHWLNHLLLLLRKTFTGNKNDHLNKQNKNPNNFEISKILLFFWSDQLLYEMSIFVFSRTGWKIMHLQAELKHQRVLNEEMGTYWRRNRTRASEVAHRQAKIFKGLLKSMADVSNWAANPVTGCFSKTSHYVPLTRATLCSLWSRVIYHAPAMGLFTENDSFWESWFQFWFIASTHTLISRKTNSNYLLTERQWKWWCAWIEFQIDMKYT